VDIINDLPERLFDDIDDLLAFISIYDDRRRLAAYRRLLHAHRRQIKGAVCLDAGCGLGYFSEQCHRLGAAKIYAVEANPHLFSLAKERFRDRDRIEWIQDDIRNFRPKEKIHILVHEFFGQMLFDEDLFVLDGLNFKPQLFLPNRARLMAGLLPSAQILDANVNRSMLDRLQGVLVSGLFEDKGLPLQFPVTEWRPGKSVWRTECSLQGKKGDLLYFGLQILHDDQVICQAAACNNWSFVWTPRFGDRFELSFPPASRGRKVKFKWVG